MKKLVFSCLLLLSTFAFANTKESDDATIIESNEDIYRIEHGYGDSGYGGCLVYGTYYIGDNGVSIFVPCGNCYYLEICPPEGGGFA
ncbi:MAG: hypothetical protein QM564_13750 [Bergeyella sp.]